MSTRMHKYELMLIANPELDENSLKKLVDQYLETVTNEKGTVDNIDVWGRRKLAYEINGKTEGNYVVVTYTALPATSDELDRLLNLNESIVRTKILRKDK
ncbi:MAG: 30S ribosomal protein S6 [Bifidobacteriaceae bacterium]|nr:30S ribosomal protein S6 [Bifidobacteriaceae bacterium]